MAVSGQHLVDVHDWFRADLQRLRDLAECVRSGTTAPGDARAELHAMSLTQPEWELGAFCVQYCRVITKHHTIEDRAMFPALRAFDPALGPGIDRLERDHLLVHGLIERIDGLLVRAMQAGATTIDGLGDLVDELAQLLVVHFAFEEELLCAPLDRMATRG